MALAPWLLLLGLFAPPPPAPGCKLVPWSDQNLGISMMVQKCEGAAAREFKADGITVRMLRPGQAVASGLIII
jgi:hypothetical protein